MAIPNVTFEFEKPNVGALNSAIEMLCDEIKHGDVEKIQALATAVKELPLPKPPCHTVNSCYSNFTLNIPLYCLNSAMNLLYTSTF